MSRQDCSKKLTVNGSGQRVGFGFGSGHRSMVWVLVGPQIGLTATSLRFGLIRIQFGSVHWVQGGRLQGWVKGYWVLTWAHKHWFKPGLDFGLKNWVNPMGLA